MVKVVEKSKAKARKHDITDEWILTRVKIGTKHGRSTGPRIEMRKHLRGGTLLLITAKSEVHPKLSAWNTQYVNQWVTSISMNGALLLTPEILEELAEASKRSLKEAYTLAQVKDIGSQYRKSR